MVNIKHVHDDWFDIRQPDVFELLEDVSALVHEAPSVPTLPTLSLLVVKHEPLVLCSSFTDRVIIMCLHFKLSSLCDHTARRRSLQRPGLCWSRRRRISEALLSVGVLKSCRTARPPQIDPFSCASVLAALVTCCCRLTRYLQRQQPSWNTYCTLSPWRLLTASDQHLLLHSQL